MKPPLNGTFIIIALIGQTFYSALLAYLFLIFYGQANIVHNDGSIWAEILANVVNGDFKLCEMVVAGSS